MNVQITSRHSKVSQDTREFITSELANLEKFSDMIQSCHVIIDTERNEKVVELVAKLSGTSATAKATEENLGKAVDSALEKLTRQLKKYNEKLKDHKAIKIGELAEVVE